MSSKISLAITLFFISFYISSCGVKEAPMRPSDQLVPSYIEELTGENATPNPENVTITE